MTEATPATLYLLLAAAAGAGLAALALRRRPDGARDIQAMETRLTQTLEAARNSILGVQAQGTAQTTEAVTSSRIAFLEGLEKQFSALRDRIGTELERIRTDNERKLDQIRSVVDDRLQKTLEARLTESFRIVGDRLAEVQRGLGEMRELAKGVGDLKRVLSNVRSRGIFGETQLGHLLDQVLLPQQYDTNVATVAGSPERVEFALRLPGADGTDTPVLLPIDSKMPLETYAALQDAYEAADPARVEESRKQLRTVLLTEAGRITKYLDPPRTTDFAVLFLPVEGLYAEAARAGLIEQAQQAHRIVVTGPSTLYAFLNAISMGFRTHALQQRSAEVWKLLGVVKTEYEKFGRVLDEIQKKVQEISNKITAGQTRTRVMRRALREVEAMPATEAPLASLLDAEPPVQESRGPDEEPDA